MKKIKKIFLGISALWSTMIAKVYAVAEIDMRAIREQTAYGIPDLEPTQNIKPLHLIGIIAVVLGLNFILQKVFKDKKKLLNVVLIISSVIVTVSIIILVVLLIRDRYNM